MTWRELEQSLIDETLRRISRPADGWTEELAPVMAHLLGLPLSKRAVNPSLDPEPNIRTELRRAAYRLAQGEPRAYILGEQDFGGYTFKVNSDTLIPRPDTEILSEALIRLALRRYEEGDRHLRILDLGTGSGCLALTVLLRLSEHLSRRSDPPTLAVIGADLSPGALKVASLNALRLLGEPERSHGPITWAFIHSDGPPDGPPFDLIMTNPPYVTTEEMTTLDPSVRDFEPHLALEGGPEGDRLLRRVLSEIPRYLTPGGCIAAEHGADQGPQMAALDRVHPALTTVQQLRDLAGRDRVTIWQYRKEARDVPFQPLSL